MSDLHLSLANAQLLASTKLRWTVDINTEKTVLV